MDGLLRICQEEGVSLSYQHLDSEHGILGLYFRDRWGKPRIILDKSLLTRPRKERSILAEEVGHHQTTGAGSVFLMYFNYDAAVRMTKTEELALRWACDYCIPVPELAEAVKRGKREVHEIAEAFGVTETLVRRRLYFLRQDLYRSQGLRVKTRELFAPILVDNLWGLEWSNGNGYFFDLQVETTCKFGVIWDEAGGARGSRALHGGGVK